MGPTAPRFTQVTFTDARMRLATIDIGTNTTLMLVAEKTADGTIAPLLERAEITRLGRGIGGDGQLQPQNIERTLEALRDYAEQARGLAAPIVAIGTEGLRRAPNAQVFLQAANDILGTPVEVITGDREATLTFLAAARSFPDATAGNCVVVDIGGGSTEIIAAAAGQITLRQSLPLGSVRLTEAFVSHDPPTADETQALQKAVAQQLVSISLPNNAVMMGAAGTVTTLAAMALGLKTYDPAQVHGFRLSQQALQQQLHRLAGATQTEREVMAGLDPRRADVIFAGACLLQALMHHAGVQELLVSDRGIRWGLLFEQLG